MIARARIRLDGVTENMPGRELAGFEVIELIGEGHDWETAKAAIAVPASAQVLSWIREP